ncbi:NAD(P)/FAD-dependent oxidoreductase [Flavitalea sp.]|nr:NAD(P)/FAD-dependent oxidoreductase [Flavitalea sp.]
MALSDVIIIGGSYAGLSAAMALGRSMREVLIVDGGNPCNKPVPRSHNLLGQDGRSPSVITSIARQEVLQYPTVNFLKDIVETAKAVDDYFELTTITGQVLQAKKILLTTGLKDEMPEINGFEACWGISVLHCPYCHGYEFRGINTVIIASGTTAFEFAELISHWTDKLSLVTNGEAELEKDQYQLLAEKNIKIIETKINRLHHTNGYLQCIYFEDGTSMDANVAYARPFMKQHSTLPEELGCEFHNIHIKVDQYQQTSVRGVFAAGDNCSPLRSLANAIAAGGVAGAFINKELIQSEFFRSMAVPGPGNHSANDIEEENKNIHNDVHYVGKNQHT